MKKLIIIILISLIPITNISAQRTLKHRLDSTINKFLYNGQWDKSYKSESTYNSVGKCVEFTAHHLDFDSWILLPNNRYKYEYDAIGNIVTEYYLMWNGDSLKFEMQSKNQFTYDANNNMVIDSSFRWKEDITTWKAVFTETYTYDLNNLIESFIAVQWDNQNNQWVNYWKATHTYNSNDQITEFYLEQWQYPSGPWYDTEKTTYSYNASNYLDNFIRSISNSLSNPLEKFYKEAYSYDINGNEIEKNQYSWLVSSSSWKITGKSSKTYNSDDDVSEFLSYTGTGFTIPNQKILYTYDNTVAGSSVLLPPIIQHSNTKFISNVGLRWNTTSANWDTTGTINYYYSDFLTSVTEMKPNPVKVFPNPASNSITIINNDFQQGFIIELFDISGKKVLSKSNIYSGIINIEELKPGVYIFRLNSKNKIVTGRFIKQ